MHYGNDRNALPRTFELSSGTTNHHNRKRLGSRGTGVPYSQWPFSPEEDHCQDIRLLHYDRGRKSVGLTIVKRFLTVPKITSSWIAKYRSMAMGPEWHGHKSENGYFLNWCLIINPLTFLTVCPKNSIWSITLLHYGPFSLKTAFEWMRWFSIEQNWPLIIDPFTIWTLFP